MPSGATKPRDMGTFRVDVEIENPALGPRAYAGRFSDKYVHRNITGGVGHNLPQEAPQAFAKAVVDVIP